MSEKPKIQSGADGRIKEKKDTACFEIVDVACFARCSGNEASAAE